MMFRVLLGSLKREKKKMIEVLGLMVILIAASVSIFNFGLIAFESFTDDFSKSSWLGRFCVRLLGIISFFCAAIFLICAIVITAKYFQSDTKVSVTLIPPSLEVEKK